MLVHERWALEDQINDLQKQSYDAEAITGQLTEFVGSVRLTVETSQIGYNHREVNQWYLTKKN
jgi:hypothetical protein